MWKWLKTNHQALTAVGAMGVGLAALFVAWDQARVMRAQQHGSVMPVLQMDGYLSYSDGMQRIGLRVTNSGVGPAIVEDITLLRDGVPDADFERVLALAPANRDVSWSTMIGRVLAAGDDVVPIELSWPAARPQRIEIADLTTEWSRWDVSVCYCSVFDQCWRSATLGVGLRPERVRHCQRPDDDVFEHLGGIAVPAPDAEQDESQG